MDDLKQLSSEIWSLLQRGLHDVGLYNGTYQGKPGPKTEEALAKYLSGGGKGSGLGAQIIERLIAFAEKEVGTVESGGNNRGPRIVYYQKATWLEPGPWPWCAAFICRAVEQATKGLKGLPFKRPETAGAFDFENWAKQPGLRVYKSGSVRRGDIVIFDFSHIGLATDEKNGSVQTIEGNTNASGSREGDGVWKKTRSKGLIRSWIRFEC